MVCQQCYEPLTSKAVFTYGMMFCGVPCVKEWEKEQDAVKSVTVPESSEKEETDVSL